jgi:hypothetical protein
MDALNLRPTAPSSEVSTSIHDVLSDEEKQAAIAEAARKKEAKARLESYWGKVKEPGIRLSDITADDLLESLTGCGVVVDDENREVVDLLCWYFANDAKFELNGTYSLRKGLFLFGGVGIGKTFLMTKFKQANARHMYRMVDCSDIAAKFAKGGEDAIEVYFKDSQLQESNVFGHKSAGWCFDDLGIESDGRYFGNQKNVMERVLEVRYRSNVPIVTHLISNLNGQQLRERYGDRILDRMAEMFNLITFPSGAKSRRK